MEYPKLLPAFREDWQRQGDGERPGKIKALCRAEEPNPESAEKCAGNQKIPGTATR
jgi:hypothetical protein